MPSLPYLKIEKSVLILEKKGADCVYPWVRFSIQNIVFRVSRSEISKMLPCVASCSCVFNEMFIEVPKFHKVTCSEPWHI